MLLVDATWPYSNDGTTDIGWQCGPLHGSTNRQPPSSPPALVLPFSHTQIHGRSNHQLVLLSLRWDLPGVSLPIFKYSSIQFFSEMKKGHFLKLLFFCNKCSPHIHFHFQCQHTHSLTQSTHKLTGIVPLKMNPLLSFTHPRIIPNQ